VNLTKEQIERFPAYDEKAVEQPEQFRDYENHYRKEYSSSGVLHREGSTHILTPEPSEMPATSGDIESEGGYNFTPDRIADKFSDTGNDPNKTRMRPGGLAARAEDTARPGASAGLENATTAEERSASPKAAPAVGVTRRESIGGLYDNAPVTPDDPMLEEQDTLMNPDDLYTPAAERHRRLASFEELLRQNKVDIAARCGSCSEKKDRAA
jgi:hypothetical protein